MHEGSSRSARCRSATTDGEMSRGVGLSSSWWLAANGAQLMIAVVRPVHRTRTATASRGSPAGIGSTLTGDVVLQRSNVYPTVEHTTHGKLPFGLLSGRPRVRCTVEGAVLSIVTARTAHSISSSVQRRSFAQYLSFRGSRGVLVTLCAYNSSRLGRHASCSADLLPARIASLRSPRDGSRATLAAAFSGREIAKVGRRWSQGLRAY